MSNIASTTKRKRKNEGIPETHCDTKIEYRKCNFTWTIIQYRYSTLVDRKENLKSSTFSAIGDDFLWYLELSNEAADSSNKHSVSDQDFVNITLNCNDECRKKYGPVSGDVEISVLKSGSSESGNKTSSFKLQDDNRGRYRKYTIEPFARVCEIKQWLCQDNLTILCELKYFKNNDVVSVSTPLDSNPTTIFKHSLPRDLEQILNEGYFSDVTISVKGKNYPAHKAILSSRCSVFKSMFRSDMQETKQNQIVITDIEQETFEEMLYYIYTGKTKNLEECAYELLPVADKYDLTGLRTMCEEVLLTKLSTDNVAKIYILADTHHIEKLKAYTLRFIKMNYASCEEFKSTEVWNILTTSRPQLMKEMLDVFFDE